MSKLLAFQRDPWGVASDARLGRSIRYLAQRLLEQQDPATLFAGSGSSRLDPLSAVVEAQRVALSHDADGQPRYDLARSMLENVQSVLTTHSGDLTAWYGSACGNARTALASALTPPTGTSGPKHLKAHVRSLALRELAALQSSLESAPIPYRRRLLDKVIASKPTTSDEWRQLDIVIDLFGATLVAEGRDGLAFAHAAVKAISGGSNHRGAVAALRTLVDKRAECYDVAVVVLGASRPRDTAGYDCSLIGRPQKWPHGASQRADGRLADFRRAYGTGSDCWVLVTSVQAFDPHGARARAQAKVQTLLDQYGARHRLVDFRIAEPVLTMQRASENTMRLHHTRRRVDQAYPRSQRPIPQMIETFRYAALARREDIPVVQILHRWIALEALAHDARGHPMPHKQLGAPVGTYAFITSRVPDLVALHATRQSVTATWDVVRTAARMSVHQQAWRQVEQWLGVNTSGKLGDLTRWTALLGASPSSSPASLATTTAVRQVAAYVGPLLADLNPFAEQAFRLWNWRLAESGRFTRWASANRAQARTALIRMYALRNASVHSALAQAEGTEQLTVAARNMLDAVLEVLPHWLSPYPGQPAWQVLNAISLRYERVIRMNSHGGQAHLDIDRLTLKQGDGATPLMPVQ